MKLPIKLLDTSDWCEDFGICLFLHFRNFDEPPEIRCGTPLDKGFDSDYWEFFTRDFDLNNVSAQAEKLHTDALAEHQAN